MAVERHCCRFPAGLAAVVLARCANQGSSITWLSSAMETQLEAAKHGHILNVCHLLVRLLATSFKDAFLLHFVTDLTK
jgi:hypothetical protein